MPKRFTIIDGYNVLHVNGFIDNRNISTGALQKARESLTGLLAKKMDVADRSRTTVVFDSSEPNLPNRMVVDEVLVEFANQHDSADELISILIAKHSAAKQLTVVSSDHLIQRAAKARGAAPVDSDVWLDQLMGESGIMQRRRITDSTAEATSAKLLDNSLPGPEFWKQKFAIADERELLDEVSSAPAFSAPDPEAASPTETTETTESTKATETTKATRKTNDEQSAELPDEIFPPGYADDLFN